MIQPKKQFRGQNLSWKDKHRNKRIAKKRIVVEHAICGVKRLRILKEQIRHQSYQFRDVVINIGCAIHNLRIKCRNQYQISCAQARV